MAPMKVTTSAAMRARDVSRPHAEHLALAEAAEASTVSSRPAGGPVPRDARMPADAPVLGDAQVRADAGGADAGPGDELLGGDDWLGEAAQDGTARENERAGGRPGRPDSGRRRWRSRGSGRGRPRT
jgi:hypothetical protein